MALTINRKYRDIVDALFRKTSDGELQWASEGSVLSAQVGSYTFELSTAPTDYDENEVDVFVTITSADGAGVEQFSDADIIDEKPKTPGFTSMYSLMKELFREANRSASGNSIILNDILRELGVETDFIFDD